MTKERQGRRRCWSVLPPLGMLLTQLIMTGMFILSKIVFDRGAFVYSFLAYRSIIAALCVAPFAFFFEREMLKELSWSATIWIVQRDVGAGMLVTLYKGKILHSGSALGSSWEQGKTVRHHWGRGTFFLIGSCLSGALWYLGQVKLFAVFPSNWATALTCAVGSLQSLLVGLALNREKWAWNLQLYLLCTSFWMY